ncbi:snoRNA binding domain, fibrillarin domain-containing protein [Ditylenchus destructor]|uniref:U4/U6 small nuclear ribonucleoprotein Prp31 n=1 Tax=Ditylenchus destructor TaxID=166010 RepID=A0AAD4NJZ2_9BILA|nr:snoRNA binding domain, fibrillarin domain-containing protein [Ditylenchus destructor]
MSLAEELLADLEEDAEEEMEGNDMGDGVKEEDEDAIDEVTETPLPDMGMYDRITDVAKLTQSQNYKNLMAELQKYMELSEIPPITAPIEADPQYKLVVKLSELATDIDQEINVIHKFVRDKYEKRFPELESLVPMPLDYVNTVKLLGNDIDTKGQNKELLAGVLPPATCIVVSVTASTSQGKPLEPNELQVILEACAMVDELHAKRLLMHQFVELRMALIAPNLCRILGAGTAAMLVSQAGGLGPLSKQPACNLLVLGKQKRTLSGFSSSSILPHAGFIYYHPIVQTLPPDLRRKAARIIAAKCTLAARVDSLHSAPDGSIGDSISMELKQKLEKLLEPPPVKSSKALPKPLDKASKKRGGRRVRKQKERLGQTELRKKRNRMNFGELQEDVMQESMGFTLGHAGSQSLSGGGRIRAAVVNQNTRVKMSQKMQRMMERRQHGGLTSIKSRASGMASSISFTPVQGIEIINPTPREPANKSGNASTYFSSTSNFVKIQTPLPK